MIRPLSNIFLDLGIVFSPMKEKKEGRSPSL